eukprot:1195052-Prorocentrum_minimum.AAC.4
MELPGSCRRSICFVYFSYRSKPAGLAVRPLSTPTCECSSDMSAPAQRTPAIHFVSISANTPTASRGVPQGIVVAGFPRES